MSYFIFPPLSFLSKTHLWQFTSKNISRFFQIKDNLACKTQATSSNYTDKCEEYSNTASFPPPPHLLLIFVVVDLGTVHAVDLDLALLLHTVEPDLGPPHAVEHDLVLLTHAVELDLVLLPHAVELGLCPPHSRT